MSSAPSPPPTSYPASPCSYPRALDLDHDHDALVASTLRILDQVCRPPPAPATHPCSSRLP